MLKRVVVTGLGCITPLGNNVEKFWNKCINGHSGADKITKFDASKFKTQIACEVKGYEPEKYFDTQTINNTDLFSQYALIAVEQAVKDACINFKYRDKKRVGCIWGAGIGGIRTLSDSIASFVENNKNPNFDSDFILKSFPNHAGVMISTKYNLQGPCETITSACASSTHALIQAADQIRLGHADMIIAGGSEAAITEAGLGGFSSMQAISRRNDNPKTASRPFDKDRDGFVMGEGGACLILEDYEMAKARGAKIYCEIIGSGMSADAYHLTAPHPEGAGAVKVMEDALKEAQIAKEEVDYINVHGTSTPRGDIAETIAIKNVFGKHAYKLNISSTKSCMGHLLGAAGAIEAIVCVLSIRDNVVPPTINQFNPDPEIDSKLNLTKNLAQKRQVNVALSNTFGFGGHNASILIKTI